MFNELIESKPKKEKSTGGTVFSIVMHAVLGGLLIYATANAGQQLTKEKTEEVKFVEVPKDEPPPPEEKAPPPPDIVAAPPPPKGFQVLRSEEHTSELQSRLHLVCRLLLEKKKKKIK